MSVSGRALVSRVNNLRDSPPTHDNTRPTNSVFSRAHTDATHTQRREARNGLPVNQGSKLLRVVLCTHRIVPALNDLQNQRTLVAAHADTPSQHRGHINDTRRGIAHRCPTPGNEEAGMHYTGVSRRKSQSAPPPALTERRRGASACSTRTECSPAPTRRISASVHAKVS